MNVRTSGCIGRMWLLILCAFSATAAQADWYRPAPEISWYIQLQGELPSKPSAELIELDLFDTSAEAIHKLQQKGKKVVCYFSAGSFEEWREDAARFNSSDLGDPLGNWPGEYWLDIRSSNVKSIMRSRLRLAQKKNCDAVDPDNVDGYSNNNGLALSASDQIKFNRFLARYAHRLGLGIGLKNDLGQAHQLVDYYDFATNESCTQYDECHLLEVFTAAGKAVFHIEYDEEYQESAGFSQLCQFSRDMKFSTLTASWDLDGSQQSHCPD